MGPVARRVHSFAPVPLIVVGALLLAGCPPPPLSLDEPDAAANSPPGITSVRNETGEEFAIGEETNPVTIGVSSMTLSLLDADLEDTLFVRGFKDYTSSSHPSADAVCNVGPSEPRAPERSVTCNLSAWCNGDDDLSNPHRMDIVVSDRVPDDGGDLQPPFYSVDTPGLQAIRVYQIDCQDTP